ncbi:DUF2306 domain-containing protein [Nonomuraea sp. NPDC049141]|uniref:DUF2306 domain-containing protein n=1 Tax=unclassified Nonomuraea TaxID=2593643 RepID=UPI0034113751
MTDFAKPAHHATPPPAVQKLRLWKRPWVVPLMLVVLGFLAFSIPPYTSLDPALSRVPPPEGFPLYYPFLAAHVMFSSVALLTCGLQVWPWFRERHPVAHRRIGRVYIFGGVIPGGLAGFVVGASTPYGDGARVSNMLLATLWTLFTVTGFRMARQHRYADHRRWMLRSFALTASIITNRIWGLVMFLILLPEFETTYGGDMQEVIKASAGVTTWLGWTVPLLIVEWWLVERGRARRRAGAGRRSGPADPPMDAAAAMASDKVSAGDTQAP